MSQRARMAPGRRDRRRPGNARRVLASDPGHTAAVSIAPPEVAEGQARCVVCRNAVTLTPLGNLRRHRDLFGDDCWNKRPGDVGVEYDATAAVEMLVRPTGSNATPPDGLCFECAKPIPPMRRLCGRCMSRRTR